MTEASVSHSQHPFEDLGDSKVPPPSVKPGPNVKHPFRFETGYNGIHTTGVGNSSNIVLSASTYDELMRRVTTVDEQAGEDLYRVALAIEEMCSRMYVVPETVPRILALTSQLKSTLGEFRSLTEEANMRTRGYVNAMKEADEGN